MGERELREKYGGKLAKAINRAIRAELPGGNVALDTLTQLAGPAMQSGWKERNGNPTEEAAAYFKHKRQVIDKMDGQIRAKWDIPQEKAISVKPRRRSAASTMHGDRKPAKAYKRVAKSGTRPTRGK